MSSVSSPKRTYRPKTFACKNCPKAYTTQQSLNKHCQKCVKLEENTRAESANPKTDENAAAKTALEDITCMNVQETVRFITETRPDGTVNKRTEVIYHVTLGDGRMLQAQIGDNALLRSILNL